MNKIAALLLVLVLCMGFAACMAEPEPEPEKPLTEAEVVKQLVETEGLTEYTHWTLDNNKLKSSSFTVATLEKDEDEDPFVTYRVYGKANFTDLYGDTYTENLYCVVRYESGRWRINYLEIDNWGWR